MPSIPFISVTNYNEAALIETEHFFLLKQSPRANILWNDLKAFLHFNLMRCFKSLVHGKLNDLIVNQKREKTTTNQTLSLFHVYSWVLLWNIYNQFSWFFSTESEKSVCVFLFINHSFVYTLQMVKKIVKKKLFMIPITMRWNGMKWHIDQSSKWNKIENFCYLLTAIFNEFMLESFIFGEFANKNWNILSRIRIYLNDETHIQILMCMRLWCRHS